eukprot:37527-Eustigmatos_ZCMA.PRE.1
MLARCGRVVSAQNASQQGPFAAHRADGVVQAEHAHQPLLTIDHCQTVQAVAQHRAQGFTDHGVIVDGQKPA